MGAHTAPCNQREACCLISLPQPYTGLLLPRSMDGEERWGGGGAEALYRSVQEQSGLGHGEDEWVWN
ncbi:unnamed protein product [Boreogadus saida]